jgi:uncharacterized membrane protein
VSDESARHFVHRLEAFSDIVIGFSLAQLGASLIIPEHAISLVQNPSWLFGFVLAFAVVCSMWFFHHRLFSRFFVPKPWPVILNFIWLAVVVLLVYATQLYVRSMSDIIAVRMYFGAYTLAYGILGFQHLIAARIGPDPAGARRGATFTFLWTTPFAVCLLATALLPADIVNAITGLVFIATTVAFLFLARHRRRESTGSVSG